MGRRDEDEQCQIQRKASFHLMVFHRRIVSKIYAHGHQLGVFANGILSGWRRISDRWTDTHGQLLKTNAQAVLSNHAAPPGKKAE